MVQPQTRTLKLSLYSPYQHTVHVTQNNLQLQRDMCFISPVKLPKSNISENKHLGSQVKCDGVVVVKLVSLYLRVNTLLLRLLWSDWAVQSERQLAVLDLLFLHLPLLPLCLRSDRGVFLFSSRERFCGEKRETMTRRDISGRLYMNRGGVTVSLLQI